MEKIKKTLSANMKKAREIHRMSQLSLAEKSNLSVQMIRDIEAGRRWPSAASLEAVARALNMRVSDLFMEYHRDLSSLEIKKALKTICEAHGLDVAKAKT